jgi:hypothetical protein
MHRSVCPHDIRSPPFLSAAAQSLPPTATLPAAAVTAAVTAAATAAATLTPLLRKPAVRRPTAASVATTRLDAVPAINTCIGVIGTGTSVAPSPQSGFTPRSSPSVEAYWAGSTAVHMTAGAATSHKRKHSGAASETSETDVGLEVQDESITSTGAARETRARTKGR